MKTILITDNTMNDKSILNSISSLTNQILDKTLNQLEEENLFVFPNITDNSDDLSGDQMVLQSVNNSYRSSNVMGFLGFDDEELIIQSRFSLVQGDEQQRNDYFFQYLLEKVLDLPNVTDFDTSFSQSERIFNLYIFLFPLYLKKAMRKGLYKTYVWRSYNNSNVKGIIDVKKHVQVNTPFVGNVAFKQREFSFDNAMNQLVRHTIEFVKTKEFGKVILAKCKDQSDKIIESTSNYQYFDRNRVITNNKHNPIRHAYYHEYRLLQRLCLKILQHQKHNIGFGPNHINGILFDGAWLWEEYIDKLIGENFYHPKNKSGHGAQKLFSNSNDYSKIGRIYPDFISKDEGNRIIADTKYKPIGNIGGKDYLQVLAYMFRFNAKKGFYIYPANNKESEPASESKMYLNEGTTFEQNVKHQEDIIITKLGLMIPKGKDLTYSEFSQEMKLNETQLVKSIINDQDVGY
ncbi:5-methylcytosine restriction system specificity protein McrC [Leuconostoc mesenteroides]|uniref:5-methylcytosine restriction system specificity protein McrC n=1 Tax=Leuconostoc mesenteroides TaxID=1245 RepID=UPI003AF7F6C3